MIRVLMLDLEGTLVDEQGAPFPYVREALESIGELKSASGDVLHSCLVSDSSIPEPPVTPAKVDAIFRQYVAILDRAHLTAFFQPVERRVTLSAHAGVSMLDRRVFEMALDRLDSCAKPGECLFITGAAAEVALGKGLGMTTLRFGADADFADWSRAPLLVSRLVGHNPQNVVAALRPQFAAHKIDLTSLDTAPGRGDLRGRGRVWKPLFSPHLGELNGVHVPLEVDIKFQQDSAGNVSSVQPMEPSPDEIAEATSFVESLVKRGSVRSGPGATTPGATHEVSTDAEGRKYLKRLGFSHGRS